MMDRKGNSTETRHAILEHRLESMDRKLADLVEKIDTKYAQTTELQLVRLDISELRNKVVSQDQFWPVKVLVYGAVGMICMSVLGAMIAFVVVTRQL